MSAYSGMPSARGWDSKVPMQPRRETSFVSGSSMVFQVTKRGAALRSVADDEADVGAVEGAR